MKNVPAKGAAALLAVLGLVGCGSRSGLRFPEGHDPDPDAAVRMDLWQIDLRAMPDAAPRTATWDDQCVAPPGTTFSGDKLSVGPVQVPTGVRASSSHVSGRWYFEIKVHAVGDTSIIGLGDINPAKNWCSPRPWDRNSAVKDLVGPGTFGFAVDLDQVKGVMYENGGASPFFLITAGGTLRPHTPVAWLGKGTAITANFGGQPFTYSVPPGHTPGWY